VTGCESRVLSRCSRQVEFRRAVVPAPLCKTDYSRQRIELIGK
jgi:hypothetical protein